MGTTQPIKNVEDINALKNYYLNEQHNLRNYALFSIGVNTALRIGDILTLKWSDVYDFSTKKFHDHLDIHEHKTGKENLIAVNNSVCHALELYRASLSDVSAQDYIFYGRDKRAPLSRTQAFRIIKQACSDLHLPKNISCHSLRKTFGYYAWMTGVNPAVLMVIYNHSSFQVTKRYLGIDQDDKDKIFLNINL